MTLDTHEPRAHVKVDQRMTQAEFKALCMKINQRFNDARAAMQPERSAIAAGREFCGACDNGCADCRLRRESPPIVEGFEPIGIDSEGGGHD